MKLVIVLQRTKKLWNFINGGYGVLNVLSIMGLMVKR